MKKRVKYPTPGGLPAPSKPFASINVEKDKGGIHVIAQVLMDRLVDNDGKEIEGAQFGLALDGSASMKDLYGATAGPFGFGSPNAVEPVAKSMLQFLSNYSGNGTVELAYWAVGPGGKEVEDAGAIAADQIGSLKVRPTKSMGRGTYLMPAINHFVDHKMIDSHWAMAIIVTDGRIDDMDAVEQFTEHFAVAVDAGHRKLIKLVLIGLGEHVDAEQLNRLDNFEPSVAVDVWSAKLAAQMEELFEIFDEVMSENFILAPSGKVLDDQGNLLQTFNDGLPAKIEFTMRPNSRGFRLEIPGQPSVVQDLTQALAML